MASNQVYSNRTTRFPAKRSEFRIIAQSIPTGATDIITPLATTVNELDIVVDTDHFLVNSPMTVLMNVTIRWASSAAFERTIFIVRPYNVLTGAATLSEQILAGIVAPGGASTNQLSAVIFLQPGDTIGVQAIQTTAGALALDTDVSKITFIQI